MTPASPEGAVASASVCPITWAMDGKVESWCIKAAGHEGPHYDRKTGAWWIESAPFPSPSTPTAPAVTDA